jgi:hypothetical protein
VEQRIIDLKNRDESYELILNLKTLANYYGLAQMVNKGIEATERALALQRDFFSGMFNNEVQDTLCLLAELYTLAQNGAKALSLYEEILMELKDSNQRKDIHRKMAPLYQQQ